MAVSSFLLPLTLLCSVLQPSASTPTSDVAALRGLLREWQRTSTALDNWSLEEDADPCGSGWNGVVCSEMHSVTNIHLSSANLSGGIPTAIGGLQELISLDLSGNPKLASTIPRQLGQLRRLTHLNLSGCNFHGEVPEEIFDLKILEYLDLSNNPQLLQGENAQDFVTLSELQGPENTGRCLLSCLHLSAECETEYLTLVKTRAASCSRQQQSLTSSRRRLLHHRTLLQVNGRTPLPMFYTYIALGVVGLVAIFISIFCFCRWLSIRKTRHADTYMMTPNTPSMPKYQPTITRIQANQTHEEDQS